MASGGPEFAAQVRRGRRLNKRSNERGADYREEILHDALRDDLDGWELVLRECRANLGLLTVNALHAADAAIVPVSMQEEGAFNGVAGVQGRLKAVQRCRGGQPRLRALVRCVPSTGKIQLCGEPSLMTPR